MSDERVLAAIGLRRDEPVRFKRLEGRRWSTGRILRIERDGSITLCDSDGAARSHRAETIQVQRPGGARGRLVWQFVSDVAVTWQQLEMF